MTASTHDAIALRAYHIWEDEGGLHGRHNQHWFAAEEAESRGHAETRPAIVGSVAAHKTVAVKAAPTKRAAPTKKATAEKPTAAKASAPETVPAPKAPEGAVVAATALKTSRAMRATAKSQRSAH